MMEDFSMHVLDIVQNSIRAEAKNIVVQVEENLIEDRFSFLVEDDGCGMNAETVVKVRSPFATSRTTRKVGLGIPMLDETCELCGGSLRLESEVGKGTVIEAVMEYEHIDRPPLGDLAGSIYILIVTNPDIDFVFRYKYNKDEFIIDTKEVKEVLDGVPLTEPSVMQWLKESIIEGISSLKN